MALTKAQRARLEKLASYLESLPRNYHSFSMRFYYHNVDEASYAERQYALKNGGLPGCGTVACAVGHGPAAGVLFERKMAARFDGLECRPNWDKYATLFVGNHREENEAKRRWEWAFASEWTDADNHHRGAAARIRYLLDHGAPPADFDGAKRKWRKAYAPYRIDAKQKVSA